MLNRLLDLLHSVDVYDIVPSIDVTALFWPLSSVANALDEAVKITPFSIAGMT